MHFGLASSAALFFCIASAYAASYQYPVDNIQLAKICQQAESVYLKTHCGINDYINCAFAKRDHALLLDCHTLQHELLPISLPEASWVLLNTGIPHPSVPNDCYNQRQLECE